MSDRSRSVPARRQGEESSREPSPEYEVRPEKKKIKKKKVHKGGGNSLANRPPWNDDTHIDGYDDVDESGRVRRKYVAEPDKGKSKAQQEQMNEEWSNSLRDSDYSRSRTYYRH